VFLIYLSFNLWTWFINY